MSKQLENKVLELTPLAESIKRAESTKDKLYILNHLPSVKEYLNRTTPLHAFLKNLKPEEEYVIKAIIAIGQAPVVFNMKQNWDDWTDRLQQLLKQLSEIENFYQQIGGIIGYHLTVLTLICHQKHADLTKPENISYISPEGLYVDQDTPEVRECIRWGIENLNQTAVIYPIGGAGDRLSLIDENSCKPVPAAVLPFLGRTLFEGMIRDLQAYEYLYYKLFQTQLHTPIAMMTSDEKDNDRQIHHIVEDHDWFGRSPDSFYYFTQPLVPVITIEGNWSLSSHLTPTLKPGGHGIIWKLAREKGILKKMTSKGYFKSIVRQINNPLAGTDGALLALIGIGSKKNKSLGFLSCERLLHTAEGTNVLTEVQTGQSYSYRITNIEYTDFDLQGIGEEPFCKGSPYSRYPTNTNILFVNIPAIEQALKNCSIPGQLINMKTNVPYIDPEGNIREVKGGRLESTMQNIADYLEDVFPYQLKKEEYRDRLQTFILFNKRIKTISTTKKSFKPGESPLSTPEQAYFDHQLNNRQLFEQNCNFTLPPRISIDEYLERGPNCIILFHPALGPLYSIIAQKIRGGRLAENAELQLEIAEADMSQLELEGSLLIEAVNPLGTTNQERILQYGNEARCTLHHVTVRNQGINRQSVHQYWKNQIADREAMRIILHEGAEFHAENVLIEGPCIFEVPKHHRLVVTPHPQGGWVSELIKIEGATWHWHYEFDEEHRIILTRFKND